MDLAGLLTDNPNVTVTVANKVCVKKGSVMKREFVDALQVCRVVEGDLVGNKRRR